jgi:hypothetical protein
MRFFTAHVRNGRLMVDELTDLPEGTHLELVSVDDVVNNGGDLLDAEERTKLDRELEASFDEEAAGLLIDAADALADLRTTVEIRKKHYDKCDTIEAKGAVNGSLRSRPEAVDPIPRHRRQVARRVFGILRRPRGTCQ